jgi:Zn-dependent metalloprotease
MKKENPHHVLFASTFFARCLSMTCFLLVMCTHLLAQQQSPELYGQQADAVFTGSDYILQQPDAAYPEFVRFAKGQEIPETEFFTYLKTNARYSEELEFKLINRSTDELGIDHVRYVQTYHGIPLDQTHFYLHVFRDKVYAFNGVLRKTKSLKTVPTLTEAQALEAAKQYVGATSYKWEVPTWEADLRQRKGDSRATHFPHGKLVIASLREQPDQLHLAYVFDISAASPTKEVRVCVDAHTGALLYEVPMESNCEAATVATIFNGNQGINTELYTADDYRLRDDCTAAVVHVRDWNSATLTANPAEIQNTTNTWSTMNELFGGTTLWTTNRSYAYFLNRFSRDSYDDANGDVSALINALFDCSPPAGCISANNASMSFSGGNMRVGLSSAGVLTNSYATLDIIGHEYAHAVTGATAELVYEEEWGALNESFSDIFGEAIEAYTLGSTDWLLGSDRDNGALRSLWNPNDGNQPDTYLGDDWFDIVPPCDGSNDECGVHTNSGVQNFWFYLVSEGGSDINDNDDAYEVTGIGITNAEAIAYRNLGTYLGANSDYADARSGAIQASIDLFGLCSEETRAVMDAWHAVGIGAAFLDVEATVTSDYNGADVSCFGTADGQATAQGTDGLPPYTYSWSNGFVGAVNSGLTAGTYFVTVTDANGCTGTDAVTLSNPPQLSATIGINSDYNGYPISCAGACDGIIEALPVGGTGPYTYTWSLSVGEVNTKIASNICEGLHSVTVTDANGCSVTADVTLIAPPPLEIEAGPNQTIFYWELAMACTSLEATGATGGVPPYTYSWSSGGTEAGEDVCMEAREDTVTIVTYYVTLTDANGCTAVDSLNVCYVDINCGQNNQVKVSICHYPPDNPLNPQTLCVSLNSLFEHLSHGDDVASCEFVSPCGSEMPRISPNDIAEIIAMSPQDGPVLEVFPNPLHGESTVRFVLLEEADAEVTLTDAHGHALRTLFAGKVQRGEVKDITVAAEQLPPGVYLVQLQTEGLQAPLHKRIIVQ